nr:MAG: major capsid protein [Microvirus sp.]
MSSFDSVRSLQPPRSLFNLTYEKKFTCDMGQLIPVMCDEVVPGDVFKIGCQAVVRFQPLVAPILHEVTITTHYFFVPYRLLWEDWEKFITGDEDGTDDSVLPTWIPTSATNKVGSLWDYLGFPVGVIPEGAYPLDFPRRAYNLVYNEYYRDQTLQDEVAIDNQLILNRAWQKDYFTSALPWQQRGPAPAMPIAGVSSAQWPTGSFYQQNPVVQSGFNTTADGRLYTGANATARQNAINFFNSNTIDLSVASTFDIADLRLAFQIQKWMERNARAGVRYTEFLKAHFGVSPRDDRLDRPEYIGGSKTPVIFSEVLQTSSTDTTSPQGNLAGHGISVSEAYCGSYNVSEYGLILGMCSIMPRPSYQQGINRQWLRKTRFDFFFPEFQNLSEQAIENAEILATNSESHNAGIFGYQGRFDEMRYKPNMVVGEMRDTFDYWHLGRIFDPAHPPALNADFIECKPADLKRIFAVQNVPGLIVQFANLIKAYRPIMIQAEPGLIDHN